MSWWVQPCFLSVSPFQNINVFPIQLCLELSLSLIYIYGLLNKIRTFETLRTLGDGINALCIMPWEMSIWGAEVSWFGDEMCPKTEH